MAIKPAKPWEMSCMNYGAGFACQEDMGDKRMGQKLCSTRALRIIALLLVKSISPVDVTEDEDIAIAPAERS